MFAIVAVIALISFVGIVFCLVGLIVGHIRWARLGSRRAVSIALISSVVVLAGATLIPQAATQQDISGDSASGKLYPADCDVVTPFLNVSLPDGSEPYWSHDQLYGLADASSQVAASLKTALVGPWMQQEAVRVGEAETLLGNYPVDSVPTDNAALTQLQDAVGAMSAACANS